MRFDVFCAEQGVDRDAEFDGLDGQATQIVGVEDGRLLATCRLIFDRESCRLGRMAVLRDRRRGGVGGRLLEAAEAVAREHGAGRIDLHAQRRAEAFYASCGYVAEGEAFLEEGIEHVAMHKPLEGDGDG